MSKHTGLIDNQRGQRAVEEVDSVDWRGISKHTYTCEVGIVSYIRGACMQEVGGCLSPVTPCYTVSGDLSWDMGIRD